MDYELEIHVEEASYVCNQFSETQTMGWILIVLLKKSDHICTTKSESSFFYTCRFCDPCPLQLLAMNANGLGGGIDGLLSAGLGGDGAGLFGLMLTLFPTLITFFFALQTCYFIGMSSSGRRSGGRLLAMT